MENYTFKAFLICRVSFALQHSLKMTWKGCIKIVKMCRGDINPGVTNGCLQLGYCADIPALQMLFDNVPQIFHWV